MPCGDPRDHAVDGHGVFARTVDLQRRLEAARLGEIDLLVGRGQQADVKLEQLRDPLASAEPATRTPLGRAVDSSANKSADMDLS